MTARKIIFGLIWLALITYSVIFTINGIGSTSPAAFQQDLDLIINMSIVEWDGINPIIIAIFFIMGIFPLVYGAFILFDSQDKQVSPYPFFLTSFGLGAFALLPYFALRQPNTSFTTNKSWLLKALDSRLMAISASISIVVFIVWGTINGDWSDFINQWHSSQFVNVMSIDFCTLSLLLPAAILKDDMARRGIKDSQLFWLAALLPLFGSLIYWCVRPQLAIR
ncbi:DUF2834 domain-containing protein [Waterburya agarophytonicola K14]|uniref:DUF2834 domain-containing protein n=1 Tax=Waterburya agarophytonicola KI4 TaxID=2874699 RepID=A0A964BRL7_9CYAN|nr:DUF2834 domain-containing protein [Waterburya agarophytonicola]MCC0177954.1 DUF2834 domain-containing protein [Waterburya agarophytonicola KI4]